MSKKRLRSEDDVGTGGTGGAGPPASISWAGVAASLPATNENDPWRYNYMYDRTKIKNQHGANTVASWRRNNLLLFLTNLPNVNENWYQNPAYTEAAIQAIRDATEPDGIMDLTSLGARDGLERVLGNAPAGQLFQAIRERSLQVAATSAKYSRELPQVYAGLPVNPRLTDRVSSNLMKLAPQGIRANWVWELLRQASRTWWDVRYRTLRESTQFNSEGQRENMVPFEELPMFVAYHADQINALIHGGDIRLDAFLCQLEYSEERYGFPDYVAYLERMFKNLYGMDSEVAVWLCKSLP